MRRAAVCFAVLSVSCGPPLMKLPSGPGTPTGDAAAAATADAPLAGLHRELFCEANPIPVKWALAELGRIPAGIRLPLTPLAAAYHPRLRAALTAAGLT